MKRTGRFSLSAICALHLATLFTLAVAHPLYEVLSHEDHIMFFAAHHARSIDIWLLVLLLSVLLPLAAFLVLWSINVLSRRLALGLYVAFLLLLFAALFSPILERLLPGSRHFHGLLALAAATLSCLLYVKARRVRLFVALMSPVIVLSPVLFLSSSSVSSFLSSPEARSEDGLFTSTELPSIVMIIFDELPLTSLLGENRQIDGVRYPNFLKLAQTSTWYRNTTALHYSTWIAIPSILTGSDFYDYTRRLKLGSLTGKLDRRRVPSNLFSLFESTHQIVALESFTELAGDSDAVRDYRPPLSRRFSGLAVDVSILYGHIVTPLPLRSRLPALYGGWQDFLSSESDGAAAVPSWPYQGKKVEEVKQFIESFHESTQPALHFVHLSLPHSPFIYNHLGQSHRDTFHIPDARFRKVTGSNVWGDETAANLAYQAHLLQLSFTDLLLGRIMDKLKQLGRFDESLIVVTSDHGASFYWDAAGLPHEEISQIQASDTLYVPLIIKAPHQTEEEISDRPVQSLDIVPTIASMLDVAIPWEVDGISARESNPPERKTVAYLTSHTKRMEFGSLEDARNASLRYKIGLFGDHDFEGLYAWGPQEQLVGRRVESFESSTSPATMRLTGPESFRSIDPLGSDLPAYVQGEIANHSQMEGDPELSLAIAISGIISSTIRTTKVRVRDLVRNASKVAEDDGKRYFLSRVPPDRLVKGENRVSVHMIAENEDATRVTLVNFSQK
jgi:hypothetical protein